MNIIDVNIHVPITHLNLTKYFGMSTDSSSRDEIKSNTVKIKDSLTSETSRVLKSKNTVKNINMNSNQIAFPIHKLVWNGAV